MGIAIICSYVDRMYLIIVFEKIVDDIVALKLS